MKCNECGAENIENSSFCTQCGARMQQTQNMENEKNEMAKRMLYIASELEKQNAMDKANHKVEKNVTTKVDNHINKMSNRIDYFVHCMIKIYKQPDMSIAALNNEVKELIAPVYLLALFAINSVLNTVDLRIVNFKLGKILANLENYIYLYSNTLKYDAVLVGEFGIKYWIIDIMLSGIGTGIFILLIILIYRWGLKRHIEWIECIKLMLAPLLILTTAKIILGLLLFVSIKLAIVIYLIVLFTVGALIVVQYTNYVKGVNQAVYIIPVLYMFSNIIRFWLQYKLVV